MQYAEMFEQISFHCGAKGSICGSSSQWPPADAGSRTANFTRDLKKYSNFTKNLQKVLNTRHNLQVTCVS